MQCLEMLENVKLVIVEFFIVFLVSQQVLPLVALQCCVTALADGKPGEPGRRGPDKRERHWKDE